jgi:hypothetical protein
MTLSELKMHRDKIKRAIAEKATDEKVRKAMVSKLPELEKQIAELEEAEKKVEKKPKPKVKSKEKKEPETTKEPWQMTIEEYYKKKRKDFIKELGSAHVSKHMASLDEYRIDQNKFSGNDKDHGLKYFVKKAIAEGKSIPPEVLADYPELKNVDKEEVKKPEPKPEPKDDIAECKKILELANYDVKSKTVKTKTGRKTIKTKEPRQDRTIIADRTKSVFTTITKAYASEEEKVANKGLLDVVESVKDLMVKFMNSLDKLVQSKDVEKIEKIKKLLEKLVK